MPSLKFGPFLVTAESTGQDTNQIKVDLKSRSTVEFLYPLRLKYVQ